MDVSQVCTTQISIMKMETWSSWGSTWVYHIGHTEGRMQ